MTQYSTLNVKSSNSQLNKLKSAIKNGTEVILNTSSNLIGMFNDETNFWHKLLLIDTQLSKIRKAFENVSSANINFQKLNCLRWYSHENLWLICLFQIYLVQLQKKPPEPSEPIIHSYLQEIKNIGTNKFIL